jgi:hypothetical protein
MEKKVQIKLDGKFLKFLVDTNLDGEPVLEIKLDLLEIPDETIDGILKKRGK